MSQFFNGTPVHNATLGRFFQVTPVNRARKVDLIVFSLLGVAAVLMLGLGAVIVYAAEHSLAKVW